MTNTIIIKSLRQSVRLGWPSLERQHPQIVAIDLEIKVDADRSHISHDISDTVNYDSVIEMIDTLCQENEWKLLEKMSHDIAHEILERFPLVMEVSLEIEKNIVPRASGVSVRYRVAR